MQFPDAEPQTTEGMFEQIKKGEFNGMVDHRRESGHDVSRPPVRGRALEKLDFLVVADLFETDTTALADVVLPLRAWTEYAGRLCQSRRPRAARRAAIKPQYTVEARI